MQTSLLRGLYLKLPSVEYASQHAIPNGHVTYLHTGFDRDFVLYIVMSRPGSKAVSRQGRPSKAGPELGPLNGLSRLTARLSFGRGSNAVDLDVNLSHAHVVAEW